MKKSILNLIIILITAIMLVVLLFFTSGIDELYYMFNKMVLIWILIAILCMALYWLLDTLILHLISQCMLERFSFKNSLRFTMIGQFFNAVTPFSSGGQPMQAYCMINDGMKPGHTISILVIRAMLFQVCMFLYTIVVFIFKASFFIATIPHFLTLFIVGSSINLVLVLLYTLFLFDKTTSERIVNFIFKVLSKIRIIKHPGKHIGKIESELTSFKEGVNDFTGKLSTILLIIFYQLLQFTVFFSIPYFIFLSVEKGPGNYINMISSQAVVTMITFLVPSPGASGGAEGMSWLFFKQFFVSTHIVPVILVWRTITYYLNILAGGLVSILAPEKPFKYKANDS